MKPINVVKLKDENRGIVIYYDKDKFLVHTENYEDLSETLVEYSFESFIKTYRLMDKMIKDLTLSDSEARKKLFKISTENRVDYGIVNKDFKGSTKISIISNNEKYKQLTIGIGDDYPLVVRGV